MTIKKVWGPPSLGPHTHEYRDPGVRKPTGRVPSGAPAFTMRSGPDVALNTFTFGPSSTLKMVQIMRKITSYGP